MKRPARDDCPVIVLAKAPLAGAAKTRLIPALGAEGAARLATRMLEDALQRARQAALGPVELCCAPDTRHPAFQKAARAGFELNVQGEGDLGERMRRALERLLLRFPRALLIGTDAPGLAPETLQAAADCLASSDAVCIPATDGGYVLIGLSRPCPPLFARVSWGSPAVMEQTRAQARQAGIRLAVLATHHDIDEPADLAHVPPAWLK